MPGLLSERAGRRRGLSARGATAGAGACGDGSTTPAAIATPVLAL